MTTFQDLPPQSRRAVRQSERDGDASAAVSSAPLNLAQTFLPTPDGAPASPQAPPATGRRSRATPQSGLVDMPTSPPAGYTADPRNAEPLNYITQGAPGSSQPAPLAAPQPAAPQQTGEQPAFRVRDFSPEGRRAAPVSAPQPTAAPLDYRTQAAPVTPSAPAAAPAPGVHATGPVSPVATQPPVAPAPDSVAPDSVVPDSAVPVSVAPVAAAPTAAPVAGAAAPVGPPLSRRELRAREAEALAASGAFSGVMPVPELVEPAPAPQANLSNAMAEFEALTRAAESDAENQPRDAAPQAAAQHATGEQAAQRTGEQFVQQLATGEQAVAQQAQQDSGEQDSAEQTAPQHAEQAQAEQDQAEQQQSAQAAAATELEADQAQAEQAERAQAEQQRASDEQAAQHAADQHAADQQAADEQAAQYAAQAEAAQQQAAQQHAAEQHAAEQAHAAEQQRARDAALAAQATAQAEANARAAADELQQSELLAERKREYEAAQAEAAQAQAAQPQAAFPAPAPANPFDALFTSPGTASPAVAQPFNVPFVEPDLEQTGSHATSTGHWSRQAALDDEFQPFENTLSRDVGGGNVATTTSALVLPIAPQDTDFGSVLNGTGEVLITGSIDLPRSLSATGGDARRYDDPDVDNLFDAFDNEIISTDSAPVRAIRAVSTHTSTHGVITSAKPKGNRLLIGAAIGAVVLAIVVVGLLIVVVQTIP